MTNISHSWSLVWSKRRRKLTDISFVFFWRALFVLTKITDVDWWNVHGDVVLLRYQWEISPLRFKEIFFLFHSSLKNGLLAIWKCTVIGNIRVTKTQKTCFALFSAFVRTLGLHEWSLYDFFSSCNSFFNRPIYDVYTSFDGLAGNTAKCVFQSPVEAKKNTSNEKMYTLCNLFLFLSLSLCRERE